METLTLSRPTGLIDRAKAVVRYRGFLAFLYRREIKLDYRGSLLGWLWAILFPLATLLVYIFVFGVIFDAQPPPGKDGIRSYPLFLFSALFMFNLYTGVSNPVMESINRSLVLRRSVYYPVECQSLASAMSAVLKTLLEACVLVAVFAAAGVLSWTFIHLIPIMFLTATFSLGLGMALAGPNSRYSDVGVAWPVVNRLLFFTSPIFFRFESVPDELWGWFPVRAALNLNPIAQFVIASREATYFGVSPPPERYAIMIALSSVMLLVGWWAFGRFADDVVEGS